MRVERSILELVPKNSDARSADPAEAEVLLADDLSKTYGERPALRGLSFSLKAGRVLGFLGPNGAGKTTAIRILTTILEPSSGRFEVAGVPSTSPETIRERIGVLPESLGFHKSNTAVEHLTYFGQLYGRTRKDAQARATALLEEVGLKERGKTLIGTYSRGMRQRLGIARTLVNDPVVVFLDEPTLGLDPRGQKELLALIRRIPRERNAGIVLCSHQLTEIEEVCDDVVILNSGTVVAHGTTAEVIKQARSSMIGIKVHVPGDLVTKAKQVLEGLPEVNQATPVSGMSGWLGLDLVHSGDGVSTHDQQANNRILEALIRAEVPILSFQAEVGRLQDAFLHLTDGAIK